MGRGSLLARPFIYECPSISAVLRIHIPLIKSDVRFSRIRLADRISRVAAVGWIALFGKHVGDILGRSRILQPNGANTH
jgi:hypothetical protein